MEKRMIIAVALSIIVLFVFQYVTKKINYGESFGKQRQKQNSFMDTIASSPLKEEKPRETNKQEQKNTNISKQEEITKITTKEYNLYFSNVGGSIRKIELLSSLLNKKEEIIFESLEEKNNLFYTEIFQQNNKIEDFLYQLNQNNDYIEYILTIPDKIKISKRYIFNKNSHCIDFILSIDNISTNNLDISYKITGPNNLENTDKLMGRNFLELNILIDDKIEKIKKVKYFTEKTGDIAWLGLKNRYFAMILQPFLQIKSIGINKNKNNFVTYLNTNSYSVFPDNKKEEKYCLFIGPLEENILSKADKSMVSIINYGFFNSITKILLFLLTIFYKIFHNWGFAIILLTIVLNITLFPLTAKSFISMKAMKKIQPQMENLKKQYKDNPQMLNKEMMQLYKKNKVNPVGGCLPMILQIPIFMALYQGLMRSFMLRGANFLWIKDLSMPEGISIPFKIPLIGNHINILPLIMVVVMFFQQKLSQEHMSFDSMTQEQKSQQKMMLFMPLLFGFMFYKMPSGLVLYWLTNTILMTIEQYFIGKKFS